ncbi:MAG: hypothetical protein LBF15_03115 [Candidatus Peribacteria bacterium]|jgi:hypothetical protein|nr:hypothetical protein [Candidatus Peribacteria bacterium]
MTYKITTVDNKVYACRCFTKEIQSLQKRYQAINNFINKYNLKYLVETKYLTRGIIVENSEYPIIKMAWIE